MRSRRLALGSLALASALLAGCTPAPGIDQEAAQEWLRTQEASLDGRSDLLGTTAGTTSRTTEGGITLSFDAPVGVAAFEVSCFGGGSAEFGYSLTGEGTGVSAQLPVACTDEPELIEVGLDGADEVTGVTSVVTRATRTDDDTAFVVAVVGTSP